MIGYFVRWAEAVANDDYLDNLNQDLQYLPFPVPENSDPITLDRVWNVCLYYLIGGKQESNAYTATLDIDHKTQGRSTNSWLGRNIALNHAINWGWTNGRIIIGNLFFIMGGLVGAVLGLLVESPNYYIRGEHLLSALIFGTLEGASMGAEYFDMIGKPLGIVIGASIGFGVGVISCTLIGVTTVVVGAIKGAQYLYNPVSNNEVNTKQKTNTTYGDNNQSIYAQESKYLAANPQIIIQNPFLQTSNREIFTAFDVDKNEMQNGLPQANSIKHKTSSRLSNN